MVNLDQFTSEGKFLMLALDHRQSFKKLMNPQDSEGVANEKVVALKSAIIEAVIDQVSGILIDEVYGLEAYKNRMKPFLLPLEKSGYRDENGERVTELEHTVEQLVNLGASGAKLLLYFNPHLATASQQIATAKQVLEECRSRNFPFFLEIVTYEPFGAEERAALVLGSLRLLIEGGVQPDVWKLEYAGSFERCQEVTRLVGDVPWVLLTRGDTFDVFRANLEQAVRAGARGFLAGRALWQEACRLSGEEQQVFLTTTLSERFKTIAEIATIESA